MKARIKNKKGFTLIELLAVIVILGLLMAIAIPSVTKYITQSRKKTLESSIHEFAASVTIDVNDSKYDIDKDNTIYAIPIECIELEKGGDDPFGKWMPANDKQWAYVLIQYDADKREYTYGFTFKDSAGYGLYPTKMEKLNGNGKLIQKDLSLNKPITGSYTNITAKGNWNGFELNDDTQIFVFSAVLDGNDKNTCTIRQDIDEDEIPEYVPEDNPVVEEEEIDDNTTAYAIYSKDDYSLTFVRLDDSVTVKAGDIFLGNRVTAIYTGFEDKLYSSYSSVPWNSNARYIKSVTFNDKIQPISTAYWFYGFDDCESIDVTNLVTNKVTDMSYTFYHFGVDAESVVIDGLKNWNVSNVKNMQHMFEYVGTHALSMNIIGLDNWDTSSVTNTSDMFSYCGMDSTTWNIGDISKWDVSNVTTMEAMFDHVFSNDTTGELKLDLSKWDVSNVKNMRQMFFGTGYNVEIWNVGDLSNWNTSSVTDMSYMFCSAGRLSNTFDINYVSKWNTSNVNNMEQMFYSAGRSAINWSIGDLSNWNVSKVTNMYSLFGNSGYTTKNWSVGDLSKWDVSKVTNMFNMFDEAGYNSTNWNIGDLSKWNTSSVTTMRSMFDHAGYSATTWYIGDISNWNTANVTNMQSMFTYAGYNANYKLNLSGWNVNKVTSHSNFNNGVTSKVTQPKW